MGRSLSNETSRGSNASSDLSEIVIVTEALTRRFGERCAVDQLTLTIRRGEIFGFLGHNGAGKTTTIRLLNGILPPSSGQVRVFGLDPLVDGPAVRRRTGVLTETPAVDERLNAVESLRFAADLFGVPSDQIEPRIQALLATFDLADRANAPIGTYSKGMRQRMALARTLIHDPEILFLDEPTSALDPVATLDVHRLITRLSREEGRTIFLCTHNLVEAQRLCDRVAVLAQGRLLALGTPAELAQQYGRSQRTALVVEPSQVAALPALLSPYWPAHIIEQATGEPGHLTIQGIPQTDIPKLITILVGAEIAIYGVTPVTPNLEEVYLALQNQEGLR